MSITAIKPLASAPATLAAMVVADADSYCGTRGIDLRMVVDTDPFTGEARVVLDVDGRQRLAPTSAQLREFALRALEAADLLDQTNDVRPAVLTAA